MFLLKLPHWSGYANFLIFVSPPFLAIYFAQPETKDFFIWAGFAYYIIGIIVPMTNKVTGLLDEVKQLKKDLKLCKGEPIDEETTDDELKPDS
ncbi:hypothetical protein MNBD_GAMMA07-1513 [hydrothermal vent metagenome]|uniref:Uncharacterized protein n=1 Tax=hydrothermal vent metagenome TaxID=652676 RepID=A0A3B0WP23_9ZZZZ